MTQKRSGCEICLRARAVYIYDDAKHHRRLSSRRRLYRIYASVLTSAPHVMRCVCGMDLHLKGSDGMSSWAKYAEEDGRRHDGCGQGIYWCDGGFKWYICGIDKSRGCGWEMRRKQLTWRAAIINLGPSLLLYNNNKRCDMLGN